MGGTEQNAIFHFGVAVMVPLPDVVSVAQCESAVTIGESTSAVWGDQCSADTHGYRALGAADIEWFAVASQHHRDDLAVARRQPGLGRRQPLAVVQRGPGQLLIRVS